MDLAYDNTEARATLAIMAKLVFSKVKGLLTAQQRTTRESTMDGFGHKGIILVYNGIDFLIENLMPSGVLYHIAEEFFKLHVLEGHFMRLDKHASLETADALMERIFIYGQIVGSERKYHSKIGDITIT